MAHVMSGSELVRGAGGEGCGRWEGERRRGSLDPPTLGRVVSISFATSNGRCLSRVAERSFRWCELEQAQRLRQASRDSWDSDGEHPSRRLHRRRAAEDALRGLH